MFPAIMTIAILVKALLFSIGINNAIITMTVMFFMIHLSLTSLMYAQISHLQDTYITKMECAAFSAAISAIVAMGTYIVIGLMPSLKFPFFLLNLLPLSHLWKDLFIVSFPTFITHMAGRIISTGILQHE